MEAATPSVKSLSLSALVAKKLNENFKQLNPTEVDLNRDPATQLSLRDRLSRDLKLRQDGELATT